ncbi:hypothetical protein Syun_012515 [Stephania yunnanensis]|uniref:Tetratricopeptide repeat protein 1 n=1 Tax=Stephania yunnanensis TaxID=152371 RepID=A0AAP0K1T6_9MAGN
MVVIEPASSVDGVETTQNQAETASREADGFETASDREGDGGASEDAFTDDQLKQYWFVHFLLMQRQLTQANDAKVDDGNDLFKAGKYEEALLKYEIAIQMAPKTPSSVEVRSICDANCVACFSKLGKYEDTIKECTKALELNSSYLKALIRRAEAHEKLEHFEEAVAGKLTEMRNSILGRFGMSVDNFKADKDPNTGLYSISFQH